MSFLQRLRSPNAIILAIVVLAVAGYGAYRATGALMTREKLPPDQLAQTADGREELAEEYQLKSEVWEQLLAEIKAQPKSEHATTMEESGFVFDVVAHVTEEGAIISIRGRSPGDAAVDLIDADRDQELDTVRVTPMAADGTVGKPQEMPIDKFTDTDRSQFLLGWSIAWGQIAEEFQQAAAVQYKGTPGNLTVEEEPLN
jgi:hypothetical protein